MSIAGTVRREELLQQALTVYKAGGDLYTLDLFLTLWGLKTEFERNLPEGSQAVVIRQGKMLESEVGK